MIDRLIGALAAELNLSPEQIADVLWIYAAEPAPARPDAPPPPRQQTTPPPEPARPATAPEPRDPDPAPRAEPAPTPPATPPVPLHHDTGEARPGPEIPATRVALRSAPSLRDPLELPRAFRRFKQVRSPGHRRVLDVEATVEATAEARRLMVVSTPQAERRLDVALVVESGPSMQVWSDTFDEFERLLGQVGAFRTVTRWELAASAEGVRLRDVRGAEFPAARLIDPSGSRLVLLATDAVDDQWYRPALWQAVASWARLMPTALIQVLPPHYWPDTAIGDPPVAGRARSPVGPNALLELAPAWWAEPPPSDAVMLPVVALSASSLASWAQAVVSGTAWADGVFCLPPPLESSPVVANRELTAADRVGAFVAQASPGAQRLARVLAASPSLSMPLIRVLQDRLAPGTGVTELAEVLVGGLLAEIPGDVPRYRFRDGVAAELRRGVTAFQEWDTYDVISRYLAERTGVPLGGALLALIADPAGQSTMTADDEPFAALLSSLATSLGLHVPAAAPAAGPSRQTVFGDIPPRAPGFIERPALLAALAEAFRDGGRIALGGARGNGQVQLAAEYARSRVAEGYDLVAWLSGEHLLSGLILICLERGLLSESDLSTSNESLMYRLSSLMTGLGSTRLFVVDGQAPPEHLEVLPPSAQVLLTEPGESGERVFEVPAFTPEEAMRYLREYGGTEDESVAAALAADLDFSPQRLALAVDTIRSLGLTFAQYASTRQAAPDTSEGREWQGHTGPVTALICTERNGEPVVVSGSADGQVSLWDARTGQFIIDLQVGAPIRSVAILCEGDSMVLAVGAEDGLVQVLDEADRTWWQHGSSSPVTALGLRREDADTTMIFFAQEDGNVGTMAWSRETNLVPLVRSGVPDPLTTLVPDPSAEGPSFFAGTQGGKVQVWQPERLIPTSDSAHPGSVLALLADDSGLVASVDNTGQVAITDPASSEWDLLPDVPWAHALSVTTAALAGHGGTLWAVLGLAGGVNAREFHTDPAALVAEFTWTDGAAPTAVATLILDDTVYAVTGHEDGTIQRRVISHLTSDEPGQIRLDDYLGVTPLESSDPGEIGLYRLVGRLSSRGTTGVYLAVNERDEPMVIKLYRSLVLDSENLRNAFLREVTVLRNVDSDVVVTVVDAGFADDVPYLVSEYVLGADLFETVTVRGLFPDAVTLLNFAIQTANALAGIHRAGVLHGNLTPRNVLIAGTRTFLTGLAPRLADDPMANAEFTGTLPISYMAPERLRGETETAASDVYSWAATTVFAATGRPPFGDGPLAEMIYRVQTDEPDLGALDFEFRTLLLSCLSRDPSLRPSASEVVDRLELLRDIPLTASSEPGRTASQSVDEDSGEDADDAGPVPEADGDADEPAEDMGPVAEAGAEGGRLLDRPPLWRRLLGRGRTGEPRTEADEPVTAALPPEIEQPFGPGSLAPGTGLPLHTLLGFSDPYAFDPTITWRPSSEHRRLRTAIGADAEGRRVSLDLKEAAQGGIGPHGLLVGESGAGKSELLRVLALGLAVTHSPGVVNFLLVRFGRETASYGFEGLPHVSATVTGLAEEPALVERLTHVLNGELTLRQEQLRDANVASYREYDAVWARRRLLEPMPTLIVIVDDTSDLLAADPGFVDVLASIMERGRSLGVHLLLVAERLQEGTLRLESHLSYRIVLRTRTAADSVAAVGIPDAYELPSRQGYLKARENQPRRFQGARITLPFSNEVGAGAPTVLDAMLSRFAVTPLSARRIWLPPLAEQPPLDALLPRLIGSPDRGLTVPEGEGRGTLKIPIGLVDRPEEHRQDPLWLDFAALPGNLGIVGEAQSGKSRTIRTIISALALLHTPREVQIYCLDLGDGSLGMLSGLPHVGGVTAERDQARRMVAHVRGILAQREREFAERGIDSMPAFRRLRALGQLPADGYGDVFLVVDDWFTMRTWELDRAIAGIAVRGPTLGIHVLASAKRWYDLHHDHRSLFGTRLELRLFDPSESVIDPGLAETVPIGRKGRGITEDGHHFLGALARIDGSSSTEDLGIGLVNLVRAIGDAWQGASARPVPTVPDLVAARALPGPADTGRRVPIGLDAVTLSPTLLDLTADPHFLIFGDQGCGKTNLLRLITKGVIARHSPSEARLIFLDYRRSLLDSADAEHRIGYATDSAEAAILIDSVTASLRGRLPPPDLTPDQLRARSWWTGADLYLVVDDHDLVAASGDPLSSLAELLPQARDIGLHLLLARSTRGTSRALRDGPVLRALTDQATTGLIMNGEETEGVVAGGLRPSRLPVGRGLLYRPGDSPRLIQTALVDRPE